MNTDIIGTESLTDEQISLLERAAAVIEPLCEKELGAEHRRELQMQARAALSIGERALRDWVRRYKDGGLLALVRKKRHDAGKLRRFDPALLPRAVQLLQENPARSVSRLLAYLRADPVLQTSAQQISASCLYHRMAEAGVDFRKIRSIKPKRPFHSFAADFPNQLWQGDARHGIALPHPDDPKKKKMTYLFAWIDDYSRFVLHAQYYFDEKLPRLEDCFRQAVLKYGLPDKIYVDNGAVYRAGQFLLVLLEHLVRKIHHPPFQAWCKGKIEALMKALLKFQTEAALAGMKTLAELNSALWAWVEIEHNNKIHSQTGETPRQRFFAGFEKRPARRITDLEKFNNSFLWKINRVVDPTGKIHFSTNVYTATGIPPGTPLILRYNPFNLSEIYLFENGQCKQVFKAKVISRQMIRAVPEERKETETKISRAAAEYFSRLREAHLTHIAKSVPANTFANLKNKENNNV